MIGEGSRNLEFHDTVNRRKQQTKKQLSDKRKKKQFRGKVCVVSFWNTFFIVEISFFFQYLCANHNHRAYDKYGTSIRQIYWKLEIEANQKALPIERMSEKTS